MIMTDAASLKIDERRAFYETDVGKLLRRFENTSAVYWQSDGRDLSQKRLKELDEADDQARAALITAITDMQSEFAAALRRANEADDNLRRVGDQAKDMYAALKRWVDMAETAVRDYGVTPSKMEQEVIDQAKAALKL